MPSPAAARVLELGCGTGVHAIHLAADGFSVHGVDSSEAMLGAARARAVGCNPSQRARLSFSLGDARSLSLGTRFHAVMALFHVLSYQTTNRDLLSMVETAASHLEERGVFVFDYWFAPAVLTERPAVRVKRLESDEIEVTRIAEPVLHAHESCVDVNYHVFIRDKATGTVDEVRETHRMRYLSLQEIEMLAERAGLHVLESCEWMTGRQPGCDTWGVCTVLRR